VQLAASGIDRRNLRGRCVGTRKEAKASPSLTRRAVQDACLVRARRRLSMDGKKKRVPFDCKATSLTGWGGVTKGRRPAVHVVRRRAETTRRVSRRPKASRLPQRRSPSRGTPERGSRSAGTRRALQPSGKTYRPTTKGCSTRLGGGEPQRTLSPRLAVERGRVPSLRTDRPTPAHRHVSTILGATDGGLVAPPRTRRREEACSSASHLATACRRRETTTKVRCGSLLSSLGRGRAIARRAVRKRRAGSGGKRIGAGGNARRQGR